MKENIILTGSILFLFVKSIASSPQPKVSELPSVTGGVLTGSQANGTSKYPKQYEIKLEQLSEGFVPEEFLANWLASYILTSFGIGLNNTGTTEEYESTVSESGENNNSTMEEFLDDLRFKALINMDTAFGPCPKGKRRDKLGNCRKQFSG